MAASFEVLLGSVFFWDYLESGVHSGQQTSLTKEVENGLKLKVHSIDPILE